MSKVEKYNNCLECDKELEGRQRKYCSRICKDRYKYNSDPLVRERKIENSRRRVEEIREIEKTRVERDYYKGMIDQIKNEKTKTKEEIDIEKLFNLINN